MSKSLPANSKVKDHSTVIIILNLENPCKIVQQLFGRENCCGLQLPPFIPVRDSTERDARLERDVAASTLSVCCGTWRLRKPTRGFTSELARLHRAFQEWSSVSTTVYS